MSHNKECPGEISLENSGLNKTYSSAYANSVHRDSPGNKTQGEDSQSTQGNVFGFLAEHRAAMELVWNSYSRKHTSGNVELFKGIHT